jgi:hypothetical protein
MQEQPVQPFDDPSLKVALRRALDSGERVPDGLRERILAAGKADGPVASDRPIPLYRRSPIYRFAAAAVVVIGFGALGYTLWDMTRQPDYTPNASYALSNSLYKAMVETHQARQSGAATPPDTVNTLAAAPSLSGAIGRATFVADLTKDGWTFQGGGVRNVGSHPAAQLFFTKDKAAISVFSLPASAAPQARDGGTYDTVFNGMPIAGFTKKGGLYCIVGSSADGSLKVDEVKELLERHRGELAKG